MELFPPKLRDLSILRRVIFAAVHLPKELPEYWETFSAFLFQGKDKEIELDQLRIAVENLKLLNENAFSTDKELMREIHDLRAMPEASAPLGVVLISSHTTCKLCGGKLLIRHDRASSIIIYTESFGTVVGTHYHKFCQHFRKGCTMKQHYGYSSRNIEDQTVTSYDMDWEDHKYIVSTNDTAFEIQLLKRFDVELLLGQISYSQKSEIYNYHNGYPVPFKQCTTLEKEDLPISYLLHSSNRYVWYMYMHTYIYFRQTFSAGHCKAVTILTTYVHCILYLCPNMYV